MCHASLAFYFKYVNKLIFIIKNAEIVEIFHPDGFSNSNRNDLILNY